MIRATSKLLHGVFADSGINTPQRGIDATNRRLRSIANSEITGSLTITSGCRLAMPSNEAGGTAAPHGTARTYGGSAAAHALYVARNAAEAVAAAAVCDDTGERSQSVSAQPRRFLN
jgi:hypothetical protein